eukprot:TRINITY_DN1744_c0_g1_i2.p1 TRINITY_DN1744_c0_g1~~TRINITY_DN1744_c0_g1_i2.p1  ORF type:complete len:489 (-),score=85.46 TRINITY_DN1744_c0_g1_i2:23-1489(-)
MSIVSMREALPITVEELYTLCFKEPEFTLLYHEKQGNTDTQVGQWSVAPEGRKMRVVRYVSPTASNTPMRKFGGMTTRVKEIQLAHFTADGLFHLTSTPLFEQSVVGIDTRVQWLIEPSEGRSCTCTITATCDFKGSLFKDSIEKYVDDQNRSSFRQWLDLVREKITDLVPSEPLPRRVITTSSRHASDLSPLHTSTTTTPRITNTTQHIHDHSDTHLTSSQQQRRRERTNNVQYNDDYNEESEGETVESDEEVEMNNQLLHSSSSSGRRRRSSSSGVFYEANDELAAVVRLDASASPDTRLATLEAYSRSTQNEMDQMEKLIVSVQGRLMRVESTVSSVAAAAAASAMPHHSLVAPHHPYDTREASDFLSHSASSSSGASPSKRRMDEEREREENLQRDLAMQRSLRNTEHRLAELEQTLVLIQKQQELHAIEKKKSWIPGGWAVGVPVIVFIICWPLVSNKVANTGLSWGSRLFLHLHHLFTNRYN